MLSLRKIRVKKRFMLFVASILLLATGVFFAIKQNKTENTNAATPDRTDVTIVYDSNQENWTWWVQSQGRNIFRSPRFTVQTSGGNYTGFCIDPWMNIAHTGSSLEARVTEQNKMKLAIYIYTINNDVTSAVLSNWGVSRNDNGFARFHAILSYINTPTVTENGPADGDYPNTVANWSEMMSWLRARVNDLGNYIDNNATVWQMARDYQLYNLSKAQTSDVNLQSIAWIEPNYTYGSITVQKQDHDTSSSTPQGNASFQGIHFQVLNNSGSRIYNPRTDTFYNNGDVVAEGNTNANGVVTFSNLPAGYNYKVRETTSGSNNASYTITNSDVGTVTLSTSGHTFNHKNEVKRGQVTVNKIDQDTHSCSNKSSELSFAGTRFQIINNSTNPVYVNGNSYAKNAVIATKTLGENDCSVTFTDLPYGSYQIKETAAGNGYAVNNNPITVTIPTNDSYSVSTTFANQPIRGDVKFVKLDNEGGSPMANVVFSISALDSNHRVKETHIVVSDQNGVVNTSSSFALHSNHTNGYDAIYDASNQVSFLGYGTWFGVDASGQPLEVSDEVGALPYGTYIIQELKCDANFFCNGIMNQNATIEIDSPNQVVDLGNWNNTCAKFSLKTTASDEKDGDKIVEASLTEGETVTIKDTVEYCVKAGLDFVIKGVLMDKETEEPLIVNGKTVESEVRLNSETECGTTEMLFTFDASAVAGKEVVVFEKLYYEDTLITSHEDINDEGQTVYLIALTTFAKNKETGEKILPRDSDVVIEDTVKYCVIPNVKYVIKGIVMNRETKSELLIDGEPVEQSVTITPEEACGELTMEYEFNTSGLTGGLELVIFESLYAVDTDDEDEEVEIEVLSHKDFDNTSETVQIELPAPDTGYMTVPKTGGKEAESDNTTFVIGTIVVCVGGYIISRVVSRKKFLKRM